MRKPIPGQWVGDDEDVLVIPLLIALGLNTFNIFSIRVNNVYNVVLDPFPYYYYLHLNHLQCFIGNLFVYL